MTVGSTILPAAERGWALRRLSNIHWAFADQGLISATNLVTMVLLARGMSLAAFGSFTLIYSVMLVANSLQDALITQPHNILGTTLRGEAYCRYTTSTAFVQLILLAMAASLVLAAAGFSYVADWQAAPLLLALAPSIVAWQLQEFTRKVLYTERRLAAAFCNDVISYGGQTVAIAALWHLEALTPPIALYALAATSALAAAYGLWQLRGSLGLTFDRSAIRLNWHFGKWLAGGEMLRWLSSAEMYQYLAAAVLGTSAAGTLKSVQVIFGPTRMLMTGLNNVLPIRFTHALAAGKSCLDFQLRRVYLMTAPVMAVYCSSVAIFAEPLLRSVYGDRYTGGARVVALYAAFAFLGQLLPILSAALMARRLTRCIFRGYTYTSLVAVTTGWLFLRFIGIEGALVGMILTILIAYLVFWRAYVTAP